MCAVYIPPRDIAGLSYRYLGQPSDLPAYKAETYPTYFAPFIGVNRESDERYLALGRFGLIPHWVKPADLKAAGRGTYNARTETVHEKPSFKTAWKYRNWCIIPAEAIYEPNYETGKPVRWRIGRADGAPLAIAGIRWAWNDRASGEIIESYSMLTINADDHPLMRRFHAPNDEKRMVVMLEDEQHAAWLNATHDEARTFFCQYPAEQLIAAAA